MWKGRDRPGVVYLSNIEVTCISLSPVPTEPKAKGSSLPRSILHEPNRSRVIRTTKEPKLATGIGPVAACGTWAILLGS